MLGLAALAAVLVPGPAGSLLAAPVDLEPAALASARAEGDPPRRGGGG